MNERIKEILEELGDIALKKICYATNAAQQRTVIKDGMDDPEYLSASVRVCVRNNIECLRRIEELNRREMDLYSEMLKLTEKESQA